MELSGRKRVLIGQKRAKKSVYHLKNVNSVLWELVTVSPSAFRKSEEMRSKSEKTRAFETLKNPQKRFDHNFDQN